VVLIGLMANNVMPARVGELVRAYLVGERERSAERGSGHDCRRPDVRRPYLVAILAAVTVISGSDAQVRSIGIARRRFPGGDNGPRRPGLLTDQGAEVALDLLNRLPHGLGERVEGCSTASRRSQIYPQSFGHGDGRRPLLASWSVEVLMYYIVGRPSISTSAFTCTT
jgi:hypothetical protein